MNMRETSPSGRRTKALVLLALAASIGAVVYLKQSPAPPVDSASQEQRDTAQAEAATPLPRLVDVGADKCIPCKMMAPILEELKREYAGKFAVEFVDVWKNPGAVDAYGIQLIPTQIFLDASGKELFRHEGFYAKEDILAKWKELGIQ